MKCHCYSIRLTLAALVALALATPLSAGEQAPFRGRFAGVAKPLAVNPPIVTAIASGKGIATHLGLFLFENPHTANLVTHQLAGTFNVVSADGDKIFADFSGQSSATSTPGVGLAVGIATVTGGTGRFTGATGSIAIQRLVDLNNSTTVGTFDGTISSPGAARR
jgi:hypothetical protein